MLAAQTHPGAADQCARCALKPLVFYTTGASHDVPAPLRLGTRRLSARSSIYREGEIAAFYYTLLTGWAFRYKLLPDGRRQILSILLPGDSISYQLMRAERLHFSVQAMTDVSLCAFDRQQLSRHVAGNSTLTARLDRLTAREIALTDDRLTDLGRRSAQERVARLVLQLYLRLRQRGQAADGTFACPLRQHHIADALGLTPVHVSRVLKKLKKDGIFSSDAERVTIRDEHRLREVSGFGDGASEEHL